MKLFRPQFTQQLNGMDLDDIPIFRREGPLCQQGVNGLAGVDEHLGLIADIRHGWTPYERQARRESVKSYMDTREKKSAVVTTCS